MAFVRIAFGNVIWLRDQMAAGAVLLSTAPEHTRAWPPNS
jgi:hypothetical protein